MTIKNNNGKTNSAFKLSLLPSKPNVRHESVYVKVLRDFKKQYKKQLNQATRYIQSARFQPHEYFEECLIKFVKSKEELNRHYESGGHKGITEEGSLIYTLACLLYPQTLVEMTRLASGTLSKARFRIKKAKYKNEPKEILKIIKIHKYLYRFSYANMRKLF